MTTFAIRPSSCTLTKKPRLKTATFGDNYEQRLPDGLNTNPRRYQLKWTAVGVTIGDAVEAFHDANVGLAFDWTPPGQSVSGKYVFEDFNRDFDPEGDGESAITGTFRQVPA